jgi:hypothetical protein
MSTLTPIYLGSISSGFVYQPGARLSKTSIYDFDKCVIQMKCLQSYWAAHLPALYSGPPSWFPAAGLYLTSYEIGSIEAQLVDVTLNYTGCLNSTPPPVYHENSMAQMSVTCHAGQSSIAYTYLAPQTTYEWITDTPPDSSPYTTLATSQTPTIIYTQWNLSTSGEDAILPPNISTQVMNYTTTEVVPSRWWKCKATVAKILVGS